MNFRSLIHLTIFVIILAVPPTNLLAATDDTASPNIVLLMSDDQGWGDVGFNGKAIISGDWKLLQETRKDRNVRLFDLAKDPYEEHDLSTELQDQTERLCKQLEELEASCQQSRDGADYRY